MKNLIPGLLLVLISTLTVAQDSNPTKKADTMNINSTENSFSCLLSSTDLVKRKNVLQQEVFSKVKKIEEANDGYMFHFEDDDNLLSSLFYYILAEKACCPFFQQDIAIGSDLSGIVWKVSGENGVKEMLRETFETLEFPKK